MKITPQHSLTLSVVSGFSLIVLLMVVLTVVGLVRIADANRHVEQLVSNQNVKTGLVYNMKDALRERRALAQLVAQMQDPFRQNDDLVNNSNYAAAFATALTTLGDMPLSAEERKIQDRVRVLAATAQPVVSEAIELALRGQPARAQKLIETELAGVQQSISAELDRLLALQKQESAIAVSDAKKAYENTRLHMLILGSIAIGLGLMIAPVVLRKANKQAQTLQQQAMFDGLTNLPNQLLFTDRLYQTVRTARHEQRLFGLFVIDLDRFKEITHTFGPNVGDQVLQYVAACIQACLNETDTVARLEGNQFAVLWTGVSDPDEVIAAVRRIRATIHEPFEIAGRRLEITASVGVVMFPHHGDEPEALMHAARTAMQAARQARRGYRIYSEHMAHESEDQVALLYELRQAIANAELVLHYQPRIDIPLGRVSGVEALVRWQHPTNGLMSAEQFIPLAEQIGLIKPLTDWVLDTALQQYGEWYRSGVRLPMSINVPTASIQDPEFPDHMHEALRRHDVPADKIEIEIKETAVISEPARAMACLRRLHAMGLQIAIGDFGSGHSSMEYLTEQLVAHIKLDKTLVKDMAANRGGSMVVRTTVKLGHTLGLKVVAKGVEDQGSWDTLKGFGCDSAQGYFMSRPLPPVELMNWLHTSQWGMSAEGA